MSNKVQLCDPNGTDLSELFEHIEGPVHWEGDGVTGVFHEDNLRLVFPNGVPLSCHSGECRPPGSVDTSPDDAGSNNLLLGVIVPMIVVALLAGGCTHYT
jgi:hypothetical protein